MKIFSILAYASLIAFSGSAAAGTATTCVNKYKQLLTQLKSSLPTSQLVSTPSGPVIYPNECISKLNTISTVIGVVNGAVDRLIIPAEGLAECSSTSCEYDLRRLLATPIAGTTNQADNLASNVTAFNTTSACQALAGKLNLGFGYGNWYGSLKTYMASFSTSKSPACPI